MNTYIWEYKVKKDQISKFTDIYGSNGLWEQLFRFNKGYIKTELHRDLSNRNRFISIDYWESKLEYDEFRSNYKNEFEILDEECENLTEKEDFIGSFEKLIKK
ncbi:MAG: hypothetical protein HeimC3_37160 [Candidatus Heimdallarchaeota archaeon LC_3]|nr:MAG: hypothetical protein HeimC3_37160 [Candidatus Heimdallarchaeota archaeon LC_3]